MEAANGVNGGCKRGEKIMVATSKWYRCEACNFNYCRNAKNDSPSPQKLRKRLAVLGLTMGSPCGKVSPMVSPKVSPSFNLFALQMLAV